VVQAGNKFLNSEEADASGTHLYKEDFSDWAISDRRKRRWFTEAYCRPENIAFTEWAIRKMAIGAVCETSR
jgi:hypothetical protein